MVIELKENMDSAREDIDSLENGQSSIHFWQASVGNASVPSQLTSNQLRYDYLCIQWCMLDGRKGFAMFKRESGWT